MKKTNYPNYNFIYEDLIKKKIPHRSEEFKHLLENNLDTLSVISLDKMLFGSNDQLRFQTNQRYRSYDKETILKILDYQKTKKLNNTQIAKLFNLSRNTLAKWKKNFL